VYLEEALAKEFSCVMRVSEGSRIAKQSIQGAGLRGITGLYLYEIVRADGTHLPAVSHDTVLEVRMVAELHKERHDISISSIITSSDLVA
jgi:hypothetical protein